MSNAINEFMSSLNIYPRHGRIDVLDPAFDDCGLELLPDDVAIAPDFMDDDCVDSDERNQLAEWYYDTLYTQIHQYMTQLGYALIHEADGSGGGLYYGLVQYRKLADIY